MRKYLTFRNAAIVAAIVLAGGLWLRNRAAAAKKTAEVKTATVQPGDVRRTLVSSGAIVAGKEAKQNFPTAGKLAYVGVAEGDKVSRGTVLMSLDTTDLQTAVTKAWYQYLAADANAKKVEDDLKGKDSTETFAEKIPEWQHRQHAIVRMIHG